MWPTLYASFSEKNEDFQKKKTKMLYFIAKFHSSKEHVEGPFYISGYNHGDGLLKEKFFKMLSISNNSSSETLFQ